MLDYTIMIYIKLREWTHERGMTIGDVARFSHVRPTLLMAILRNPTKNDVSLKVIDALAKALEVPAQTLIESRDEPQS